MRNDPNFEQAAPRPKFEDSERVGDIIRALHGPTVVEPSGNKKRAPCQL